MYLISVFKYSWADWLEHLAAHLHLLFNFVLVLFWFLKLLLFLKALLLFELHKFLLHLLADCLGLFFQIFLFFLLHLDLYVEHWLHLLSLLLTAAVLSLCNFRRELWIKSNILLVTLAQLLFILVSITSKELFSNVINYDVLLCSSVICLVCCAVEYFWN